MKIAKKKNLTLSIGILILIYLLLNTVSYNPALAAESNPDHCAKAYIATAEKTGHIKGMGDGSYHPEDTLTRAQGISLILRLSTKDISGIKLTSV
jgi:hypothetical protein